MRFPDGNAERVELFCQRWAIVRRRYGTLLDAPAYVANQVLPVTGLDDPSIDRLKREPGCAFDWCSRRVMVWGLCWSHHRRVVRQEHADPWPAADVG